MRIRTRLRQIRNILALFVIVYLPITFSYVQAVIYNPGDTLNPSCTPDVECEVTTTNLGNTDLTLTEARAIDMNGYDLTFNGTSDTVIYNNGDVTVGGELVISGGLTVDSTLVASNLGIEFIESDTNPTCAVGDYRIYADTSEGKLKKCENGVLTSVYNEDPDEYTHIGNTDLSLTGERILNLNGHGLTFDGSSGDTVISANGNITAGGQLTTNGVLSVSGDFITARGTDYTATGTQNNINFGTGSLIYFTGSGTLTITGVAGGVDGKQIRILNNSASNYILNHQDTNSLAANRILIGSGVPITIGANSGVTLMYDSAISRWRLVQIPASSSIIGAFAYLQGGNSYGTTAVLGTNDANPLDLRTNGVTALSLDTLGNATLTGDLHINGDDLYMNTNTVGAILVGDGTNFNPVVMSGDATIASNGGLLLNYSAGQSASGTTKGFLTAADWNTFNGKQNSLGYTAENTTNKTTDINLDGASNTKYPSAKAVKDYTDNLSLGLNWHEPAEIINVIANTSTPVVAPTNLDVYIIDAGGNTGVWSEFAVGDMIQYQLDQWVFIKAMAVGDWFGVSFKSATVGYGDMTGKDNYLVQITGGSAGNFTYTFEAPANNDAVFVGNQNAYFYNVTFTYSQDLAEWVQLSATVDWNIGSGLDVNGTTVSLGSLSGDWNQTGAFNIITAGDIAVNGGDITTTATTASIFDENVTTLNIGGDATTINFGASGAVTSGGGALILKSGPTTDLTLDSGTTGTLNIGTGDDAKTVNVGTGNAGNILNIGTNNTVADNINIGSSLDAFTLTSTGLKVTSGGALTGVASIDTILYSATAMTFAGTGTISSTGSNSITIDSGTTGSVNVGTSANAKTVTIGNTTGASTLNLNSGSGGISLAGAINVNSNVISNIGNAGTDFDSSGGLALASTLTVSNLGIEFTESDTNPTCAAGNYGIYADTSEGKLKKCENGVSTDLYIVDVDSNLANSDQTLEGERILSLNGHGLTIDGSNGDTVFASNGDITAGGQVTTNGVLAVAGDFITGRGSNYIATGTQNNVNFGTGSLIYFTGSGTLTITGIAGGVDGKQIRILNNSASNYILNPQDTNSLAANRILIGSGVPVSVSPNSGVTIMYDSAISRWRLVQIPASSSIIGAFAYLQGGNSYGTTAVLGTNDANPLDLRTNGVTALSLDTLGNATLTGDLRINGDDLYMNTNTVGAILVGDGTNFNPVVMSGDATIASNGGLLLNYSAGQSASGTTKGFLTAADWDTFNNKQNSLGYTAEDNSNKTTNLIADGTSNTKYPSAKAVKDYTDNLSLGLNWQEPVEIVNVIANTSTPVVAPTNLEVYIIDAGGNTGVWSAFDEGDMIQYQTDSWVFIKALAVGDRFGVSFKSAVVGYGDMTGKDNQLVEITGGSAGNFTYTFQAPNNNDAVFVSNSNAYFYNVTFTYSQDLVEWVQLSAAVDFDFANGLKVSGTSVSLGDLTSDWNQTGAFNIITAGDIAVNGGDITTTATTASIFDENVTTLNIGGDATTINFGASGALTSGGGALTINSGPTSDLTLDSGTTGTLNVGTGDDAKTVNMGTGNAGNIINVGTNNTVADTINVGSALDAFTLTSSGLNVTSAGALTGVASIDSVTHSATAITFAGTGTISSTGSNSITIDSGTTGSVNVGTSANAKTVTIGNTTGTTTLNINSGSGGISLAGAINVNSNVISNIGNAGTDFDSSGGLTLASTLTTSNLGIEFTESDTNPTCAAGNYGIYADTSEGKLKRCENGVAADLFIGNTFTNGLNTSGTTISLGDLTSNWTQAGAFDIITAGDININGGDLKSTSSTATLFNTGSTTLNIGGAATTINMGAAGAVVTGGGALTVISANTTDMTVDSGTTGTLNVGTGDDAKTVNVGTGTAGNTINVGTNNTVADTINIGSALDAFTLTSSGLNITSGGALTGVATIDTVVHEATGITFAGAGTVTSTGSNSITIDSGTTGSVNVGTSANAKTVTIGNTTGTTTLNLNSGSGGISLAGAINANANVISNIGNAGTDFDSSGGLTLASRLTTSNLGIEFSESDTNPTCAAGNYGIYADTSEGKLKKCQNGTVSDLDLTGSTSASDLQHATAYDTTEALTNITSGQTILGTVSVTPSTATGDVYVTGQADVYSSNNTDQTLVLVIETTNNCTGTVVGNATRSFIISSASSSTVNRGTLIVSGIAVDPGVSAQPYSLCASTATGDTDVLNWRLEAMVIDTGADLAEIYNTNDLTIEAGDVVSYDSNLRAGVRKSNSINDDSLLGVISTRPGLLIGGADGEATGAVPVALSGRVPVKVTNENGEIKIGDYLSPSSIPGVAMKATTTSSVIGQAMDSYNSEEVGKILIFIKNGVEVGGLGATAISTDTLDSLVLLGGLEVNGEVDLGKDTVGEAVIEKGDTEVEIVFEKPYIYHPIVTITKLTKVTLSDYYVAEVTENGFKIVIDSAQAKDVNFSWHSFGSKDGFRVFSNGEKEEFNPIVLLEPTQTEAIPTLEVSAIPTVSEPTSTINPLPTEEVVNEPLPTDTVEENPEVDVLLPQPSSTEEPTLLVTQDPTQIETMPTTETVQVNEEVTEEQTTIEKPTETTENLPD